MDSQRSFPGLWFAIFLIWGSISVVSCYVVESVEVESSKDVIFEEEDSQDGSALPEDLREGRNNFGDLEVILNPGPILSPDIVIGHFVDSNVNIHDTILEELGLSTSSTMSSNASTSPVKELSHLWPQKIIVDKKVGSSASEDDEDDDESEVNFQLSKYLTVDESKADNSLEEIPSRESRREHCFQKINATSGSFKLNFSQDCTILISSPDKMSRLILHCGNIKLGNCSSHRDSLTVNVKGDLRFGRNSYLYCGPNSQVRTTSLRRKISIRLRRDLDLQNETECKFFARKQRFLDTGRTDGTSLCGRLGRNSKIVGGKRVSPGLFPWMAQLDITRTDGSQTTCTGSLVSNMFILTAAHCLKNSESISIFLGGTDRLEFTGSEVTVQAEKYILHRNWNPRTLMADMALVKLSDTVRLTEEVSPICLPDRRLRRENISGFKGVAAGWGRRETTESAPRQLYRVKLPFLNDGLCFLAYRRFFKRNFMMCTESTEEAAICYGDSGGPLMYKRKELVYQVGIASYSSSKVCGESYDVFTKLGDDYVLWINTKIRSESS